MSAILQTQPVAGDKVSVRAMASSPSQDASASAAAAADMVAAATAGTVVPKPGRSLGRPGALGCMSAPEALDIWDTPGVWTLPGRPPIISEHPEYQLTGSTYPSERRHTNEIIPAPVWSFNLDHFTIQTDQNMCIQLPRANLIDVPRSLGPQMGIHAKNLDRGEN